MLDIRRGSDYGKNDTLAPQHNIMRQSQSSYFNPSKSGNNLRPNLNNFAESSIVDEAGEQAVSVNQQPVPSYFKKKKKKDMDEITSEDR